MPKNNNTNKLKVIHFSVSAVIGLLSTLISLLIFAVIFTLLDLKTYYNAIFATLSLIIGSFVGASTYVRKLNNKGFINGTLMGAVIFAVVFLISVFISENSLTLTTVFHLISCVLAGAIGGIIQVNRQTSKKYLK